MVKGGKKEKGEKLNSVRKLKMGKLDKIKKGEKDVGKRR